VVVTCHYPKPDLITDIINIGPKVNHSSVFATPDIDGAVAIDDHSE
jgi:hypothetical protein